MPMSLATFLASDISLVVINSDTAVMAIALSPKAICVALASTELSTPPEKLQLQIGKILVVRLIVVVYSCFSSSFARNNAVC